MISLEMMAQYLLVLVVHIMTALVPATLGGCIASLIQPDQWFAVALGLFMLEFVWQRYIPNMMSDEDNDDYDSYS
jgi:hypothetical protein